MIRVPVINAHGAGEAKEVHARIRFLPDDRRPTDFGPGETQGEWPLERGGRALQIDIPGNGRPHMLDVLLVLRDQNQPAFEWTARSRAAHLTGYGIEANPIPIETEVMGSGPAGAAPHLKETLEIDLQPKHMLKAGWLGPSRNPDEGDNWAPWT